MGTWALTFPSWRPEYHPSKVGDLIIVILNLVISPIVNSQPSFQGFRSDYCVVPLWLETWVLPLPCRKQNYLPSLIEDLSTVPLWLETWLLSLPWEPKYHLSLGRDLCTTPPYLETGVPSLLRRPEYRPSLFGDLSTVPSKDPKYHPSLFGDLRTALP